MYIFNDFCDLQFFWLTALFFDRLRYLLLYMRLFTIADTGETKSLSRHHIKIVPQKNGKQCDTERLNNHPDLPITT